MSKLATSLDQLEITRAKSTRRASCFPLYGDGDLEDKAAVDRLRDDQVSWNQIQETVDTLLGISEENKINNRRFIRHWSGECSCWDNQR